MCRDRVVLVYLLQQRQTFGHLLAERFQDDLRELRGVFPRLGHLLLQGLLLALHLLPRPRSWLADSDVQEARIPRWDLADADGDLRRDDNAAAFTVQPGRDVVLGERAEILGGDLLDCS